MKIAAVVPLYEGEEVVIDETKGVTLAEADAVFDERFSDFREEGVGRSPTSTAKQPVMISEIRMESEKAPDSISPAIIFHRLSSDLDALCLTWDQVVKFCAAHRDKFSDACGCGGATLFLIKKSGHYLVVFVKVRGPYLGALVCNIHRTDRRCDNCPPRVVVPKRA